MTSEKNKHVEWFDVTKPRPADIEFLEKRFGLHPVIVEELQGPSARAKVERHDGYLFFIYYFPVYNQKEGASMRTEIDFIVTKNAIATVHFDCVAKEMEGFSVANEKDSLGLLRNIIQHLITFEERELRHVREKVETVGRTIFKDKEREVLELITHLKRDISECRIVARLETPVLESLRVVGKNFWGGDSEIYLNDLIGEQLKLINQLDDYRVAVLDFEHTNDQLMNMKINHALRTLTSLSFLTFPFVLVAALFAMRTPDTPLATNPNGFWIIVVSMIIVMSFIIAYFKKKNWL